MLTVKSLAWALWLAMSTWVPPHEQTAAWREPEAVATGRYLDVAESIATVCLDPDEPPVPGLSTDDGEARARSAMLLAAIGSFESRFAAVVVDCRTLGPGKAKGPFQCEGRCPEVCTDVEHAARVALTMLRQSFDACSKLDVRDRASWYTDGACKPHWPRSRNRYSRAERWWTAHPLAWAEGLREGWGDWD